MNILNGRKIDRQKKHFIGRVDHHRLTNSDPDSILDPDPGYNLYRDPGCFKRICQKFVSLNIGREKLSWVLT